MNRERALKVVLVLVGLLFLAGVYPIVMYLWRPGNESPGDAMMLSLYVTLHWCSPDRAGSGKAVRRAAIASRCVGSHSGETGPIQNWIRSPGMRGHSGKLIPRKGVPTMTSAERPSLYERLGGVYSIATVVDDLIDRVMVDPRLNANPLVDEAHHRVPPAGFKYLVTEMVCWASGGPQKYTGKPMADSHAHLKITGQEWEAFLDDFQQTLDKFKVPAEEQAELKAIVDSTRSDIVIDSPLRAVS